MTLTRIEQIARLMHETFRAHYNECHHEAIEESSAEAARPYECLSEPNKTVLRVVARKLLQVLGC